MHRHFNLVRLAAVSTLFLQLLTVPPAQAELRQCTFNHECPESLICDGTRCIAACATDRDCAADERCFSSSNFPVPWLREPVYNVCVSRDVLPPQAVPVAERPMNGISLSGGDYKAVIMRSNDPDLCYQVCLRDQRCASWTFVYAGVQTSAPVCWLKSNVPLPRMDGNCVSGVKQLPVAVPTR